METYMGLLFILGHYMRTQNGDFNRIVKKLCGKSILVHPCSVKLILK